MAADSAATFERVVALEERDAQERRGEFWIEPPHGANSLSGEREVM